MKKCHKCERDTYERNEEKNIDLKDRREGELRKIHNVEMFVCDYCNKKHELGRW